MYFKKIFGPNSQEFKNVWRLYESSFPSDERRSLELQTGVFDNKLYSLLAVLDKSQLVGFLAVWEFEEFIFGEHFAVMEKLRNRGIGSTLLREYMGQAKKGIVGEVEKPETEIARKRIGFYERLGFKLNAYDYIQPSYGEDKEPVPLFLISFPGEMNEAEFLERRNQIHRVVYGCEEPVV